jgi:hypothetical protein
MLVYRARGVKRKKTNVSKKYLEFAQLSFLSFCINTNFESDKVQRGRDKTFK